MEKIYTNNSNKKNTKNVSVLLSLSLAIIAVVAVVLTQFNKVSYALPDVDTTLTKEFTGKQKDDETMVTEFNKKSVVPYEGDKEGKTDPVYCLQAPTSFGHEKQYKLGNIINDPGLLYLLANLYDGKNNKFVAEGVTVQPGHEKEVQYFLSQIAVWAYQYQVGDDVKLTKEQYDDLIQAKKIMPQNGGVLPQAYAESTTTSLYKAYKVEELVEKAIKVHNDVDKTKDNSFIKVVMGDATPSVTSDGKYYQTDKVSVVASVVNSNVGEYTGTYAITKNNLPEGSKLIYADGVDKDKEVPKEDYANMKGNFYIRIPVDAIKSGEAASYDLEFEGIFKTYGGYEYTAVLDDGQPAQKVTTVKTVNVKRPAKLNVKVTKVPDTGLNNTKTIYMIGILVLVLGVVIILVNARPLVREK